MAVLGSQRKFRHFMILAWIISCSHSIIVSFHSCKWYHSIICSHHPTISDGIIYHSTLQSFDGAVCCSLYHLIVHCFGFLPAQTGRLGAKFKKSPEHIQGLREKNRVSPVDSYTLDILVSLCSHFHEILKHRNVLCVSFVWNRLHGWILKSFWEVD